MAADLHIFGIRNCDTMKKARAWLADAGLEAVFHDYKLEGVDPARLAGWAAELGVDRLLNRAGTTFRKLPPEDTINLDEARSLALMVAHPSLIRRPVLETPGGVLTGFSPEIWEKALRGGEG